VHFADSVAVLTTRRIGGLASFVSTETRSELDTHADTCVVGKHCLIFHDFERPVGVTGFDPSSGERPGLPTVSAALAYDDPESGKTIILVVHQAISIPTMENNLLSPMQMRLNDVKVHDVPKFLCDSPEDEHHSIVIDNGGGDILRIPLALYGVTSHFPTRKPTQFEFDTCEDRYELTYELPDWEPHSEWFRRQEENVADNTG